PPTRTVDLRADPLGAPLQPKYVRGFAYSDCWVDDARLVVLNAVDAAERSASIRTRTRCTAARREGREWRLTLAHGDAPAETVTARALVNATGPWVAHLNEAVLGVAAPARVRLVKGSHIIVPRLFAHDHAYIFQAQDGRIVFAIPYEHDFTLIGTTDIDYAGEPGAVTCSDEEIAYLCRVASDYFKTGVAPASVVWTYSGVRPLYDDGASKAKDATRDYVLVLDAAEDAAPVLMVFGGKITTYRRLAEETLAKLAPHLPMAGAWTAAEPLPGGDFAWDGIEALTARCRTRWPFLQPAEVLRMVRAYGTRIDAVLGDPARGESPVIPGSGLREAELHYLMTREWAMTAEDVLWRRTKLGLRGGDSAAAALTLAMERESSRQPAE
ncbi:MAG: glycerol-3-phosphate dehydrogenase, partial [Rhizobiales bacterium]|nr:glycerol-3-phosphate dehydrogenase [Hyphomicrobiales bacterium]